MVLPTRQQLYTQLFPDQPAYRWQQIEEALWQARNWDSITTIPKAMKETLSAKLPWMSYSNSVVQESKSGQTYKAGLQLADGEWIETVLMQNKDGQWTSCVSSQVGCAMGCNFCLTGTMGLKRNLNSDEVIDQIRFWQQFLSGKKVPSPRISNIVMMGMGEPMLNYDAVKEALQIIIRQTDIGPTHITVSSVGIFIGLEKLLIDPDWPPVRIAISLHSADPRIRKELIPTTPPDFFSRLGDWIRRYHRLLANRRHYITFEYIMIEGINDSLEQAAKLARLVNSLGPIKVNLIPYNMARQAEWHGSPEYAINEFMVYLKKHGIMATSRKPMGDDIMAACGQLAVNKASK